MIPGFFGGLGYGAGLQYSYARGFPAFETGGAKGFVDVVKRDAQDMLTAFTQDMFGNKNNSGPVSGTNVGGLTYSEWAETGIPDKNTNNNKHSISYSSPPPKETSTRSSKVTTRPSTQIRPKQQLQDQIEKAKMDVDRALNDPTINDNKKSKYITALYNLRKKYYDTYRQWY